MKKLFATALFSIINAAMLYCQNVGIGTNSPSEKLHVVGDKILFEANFVGIGTATPPTGFTSFTIKKAVDTYVGMYVDAGAAGLPFYGYALNGTPRAYSSFNGTNNQFEYHQSSDATPDFAINGNTKAVFNTGFVGIGTSTPPTGFTSFAIKKAVDTYVGMYVDAGAAGLPFYGYALNGTPRAYSSFNGTNNQFEYHQSSDAIPDFAINGNAKAVFNTGFVGIGTATPTSGYTSFAIKKASDSFVGMYIDAGAAGVPFYGYALSGSPKSYTSFNSANNQFEYHQSSDAIPDFAINGNAKAVFNTGFVGIGTATPTSGFTSFAIKKASDSFVGMYIDAGAAGVPFYGYALSGSPKSYTSFNSANNQFEYHQSSDAIPDFAINGNYKAVFNTNYVCVGTNSPLNGYTGLTLKNNVNDFYGMYIDAGATGKPFYGYALNGIVRAYSQFNGITGNWELITGGPSLVVTPTGNVGVGGVNPTQKLDVAGTIHASNLNGGATSLSTDASGNIIRTPSDGKLKKNITEISDALSKLMQLRPVSYDFIDAARFGTNRQIGFIAQEIEKVVPEAVSSGGEYLSVNYQILTAILTEAIKEQQSVIDLLEKENSQFKQLVTGMQMRLTKLEKSK